MDNNDSVRVSPPNLPPVPNTGASLFDTAFGDVAPRVIRGDFSADGPLELTPDGCISKEDLPGVTQTIYVVSTACYKAETETERKN